jgi:predicted nucleic acid-binding protein
MRVLLDTNILLDLVLAREPFAERAAEIWESGRAGQFDGFISAISPLNVFYVVRKERGAAIARQAVHDILLAFSVCAIDLAVLEAAFQLPFADYEDAVQLAGAIANGLDAVVTRDPKDFKAATLPIFSPVDFLKQLSA